MKKTTWMLIGFCLIPSAYKAMAGADLVIYYDGRPGITYQDVPGLEYVFFELDQLREGSELSLESLVGSLTSRISSQDLSIKEDFAIEVTGLTNQRVRLTATGLGFHLYFRFKCPLNIKKAKIDASLYRAIVSTEYDLVTGSTPYNVNLQNLNVRVRPGISFCSLASIANLIGFNVNQKLTDLAREELPDVVENLLTNNLNLDGLGQSFLGLDPYVQAVPNSLFQQIGLTKSEVMNVLHNPFSGTAIKVLFNEDGLGYNGANDKLMIWIDVPWEHLPVASFDHTNIGPTEIRLDASSSYDPDGGPVTYLWHLDGTSVSTTNPIINHVFPSGGTKSIILTVTDDEGARGSDYRYITLCNNSSGQPSGIPCDLPPEDEDL